MSFSETDLDERRAVVSHLIAALTDESQWVRVGAVQSLAKSYPDEGREALKARWGEVLPGSVEQFALALALELCGEDTLPLLAPLLRVNSPADLEKALGISGQDRINAHDNWVYFLRDRRDFLPSASLNLVSEIRPIRLRRAYRSTTEAEEPYRPGPHEAAADTLESELRSAYHWLGNKKFEANSKKIFEPILASLRSRDGNQNREAVLRLVELALCEPNGWLREASQAALVRLEAEAGNLLLPGLWGQPPAVPDLGQLRALASQAYLTWDQEIVPTDSQGDAVGSFFATKTLAKFTDEETVSAIVGAAVEGVARAEDALSDMPIDISLPALFWAAVNNADWDERHRASEIILKIITKDLDYGIHYHQVGWMKVQIEADLGWITQLLARGESLPAWVSHPLEGGSLSWIRNKPATLLLLSHAIRMIPPIEGTRDVLYSDSSTWDRFIGFTRRMISLVGRRDGKAPGATTVERYLACDFPKQCVQHEPARLTLCLDVAQQHSDAPASEVNLVFKSGETEVKLLALVRAPGFLINPDYRVLSVPLGDASPKVDFTLTPHDLGAQTVEVTLLRDAERVGYTCLVVNVEAKGVQSGQADALQLDGTSNRDLLRLGPTRAVIQVEWRKDGTLAYRVIDPSSGSNEPHVVGVSPGAVLPAQVQDWTVKQSEAIRDYLKADYATPSSLKGALSEITSIGYTLFEQLAPPEMAALTQKWLPGSIIAVDSNEGWVPWELLSDSALGPVWGERFQMIRAPAALAGEDFDPVGVVPGGPGARLSDEIHKITSVVGDGIERGDQPGKYSRKQTFGKAEPLVTDLIECEFDEFREQIEDADIVHFTCHGRKTPLYNLSFGNEAGKRLLIGQVEELNLKHGVMIFANACSSDQPELFLTEFQNFGWKFYRRGARLFIGTLGPVPSKHAIIFAQHFYEWFITKGLPAGQALRQARFDVAKEFKNPFYLFYCLYGSALAYRRIRPLSS